MLFGLCRPSTFWSNAIVQCKICTANSLPFWMQINGQRYVSAPHLPYNRECRLGRGASHVLGQCSEVNCAVCIDCTKFASEAAMSFI